MSEWRKTQLGECCEIISGATPNTSISAHWGGDICWATPKDLSDLDGALIATTPRKLTREGLNACAASVLPPGSVLLSSRAPIGHVAINTIPMATNQGFKSFIPKPDLVETRFLYWWLRTNRPYLESLGNGVTFKEISKAVVSRVEIPLPPIVEQRRIADILDRAEALRAKRRAALARLETLTQAIFLDLFGDPVQNPIGFPVRPMMDLVDPQRPISYGILVPGPDQDEGVMYVRVVDMKDGGIEVSQVRRTTNTISNTFRRSLLKTGDLLLSIRGHVGRLAIVPQELDGANITQDTARLAVREASPIFVRECLRTDGFQRWMAKHTKGAAVRGINLSDVKSMPIILPPREEQDRFSHRVAAVEKLCSAHRASLAELDALFASLQYRGFRGEL